MSNLFTRPKPDVATTEDIRQALDEITAWDWQTGYSFAHSVIDDHNLNDRSILFCLNPVWVEEVMTQKLHDRFKGQVLEDLHDWELPTYVNIMRHMLEIFDLLNWLLAIPEEIRNQVD